LDLFLPGHWTKHPCPTSIPILNNRPDNLIALELNSNLLGVLDNAQLNASGHPDSSLFARQQLPWKPSQDGLGVDSLNLCKVKSIGISKLRKVKG
jgi:hypothetical protein